ncbi:MAG: NUDIX hydrolase [Clostridia bacterium]|nr:NUDIX hydrolase [Clostridia bacterium]
MDLREKEISREYKFEGRIVKMRLDKVETPAGRVASREIVEHPGGVGIVALTDEGEIYMEWQYRRPYDDMIYEIPAGKMEGGEEPIECAKRELEEEIGLCADNFVYLGASYASPGFCTETLHIFLATGLYEGKLHRDVDEFLIVEKVKLETLVEKCMSGEIKDGKSLIGILKTNEYVNRLKTNQICVD